MAFKVGEMFVSIGVQGADKTIQAFTQVKGTVSEVASSSLAAKASILAMFYAVEQLTKSSAMLGTSLLNFTALTGQASQGAERWGNAAKTAGGSFNEAMQTWVKVQQLMMQIQTGQGMPRAFAYLEKFTGLDRSRIQDTEYVMKHIRDLAKVPASQLPPALRNQLLTELGFSPNMISLSNRKVFDEANLAGMPVTSAKQQRALDTVNRSFERMFLDWETEFKKLTAENPQAILNLEKLSMALLRLFDALDKAGKASGVYALLDSLTKLLTWLTNEGSGKNQASTLGKTGMLRSLYDWRDSIDKAAGVHSFADTINLVINVTGTAGQKAEELGKTIGRTVVNQIKQYSGQTNARKQAK